MQISERLTANSTVNSYILGALTSFSVQSENIINYEKHWYPHCRQTR